MPTLKHIVRLLLSLYLSLALFGCKNIPVVYKIDIEQGNIIDQEMTAQLTPGMSHEQVKTILGTPMLVDVFHQNRWDYYYYSKEGRDNPKYHNIVVLFDEYDKMLEVINEPIDLP